MDGIVLPIIVAVTAILLIWGVAQAVLAGMNGEKRKLKERLTEGGRFQAEAALQQSIKIQVEATGLSGALAGHRLFHGVYRSLLQAFPEVPLARFLCIAAGLAVTCFIIPAIVGCPVLIALVIGAIGGYAPFLVLNSKRNKRQRLISMQLPESLDFLSRILRAGHSLTTGLQMLSEELPPPLSVEFRRCYSQHSLGQPLEECLKDMATRVESTDFAFFVTAILIQRQTGGDLAEVLKNISGMIRQRIRLQQTVKAKTAEGRFSGYILVAFPAVMFLISYFLNPEHTGILLRDSTGLMLLGGAVALQLLGLFAIRQITTVKV